MSFGRKAAAAVLSSVLAILLFATAVDIGFNHFAGGPGQIKNVLEKSGVYNSVVPGLLDEAKTISSTGGSVPLSDPIVRTAATSTLTPQYLRTNVNQALDSIYQWLGGKTSQPKFTFNFNDIKNSFADKVALGARQKAANLPACTTAPSSASFDAFSATCLPPGVTPDQVAAQVRTSITSGQGFLDNGNITANDLKANGSKQSVFSDQLKNFPKGYQRFRNSPLILSLVCLVLILAVIFVYRPNLRGLRHIGFMFAGTGLLVILFAFGLRLAASNKVISNITLSNSVLQSNLRTLVHDFAHNLSGTYLVVGLVYIALGAIAIGATYMLYKRYPQAAIEPSEEKAVSTPSPKPPTRPKKIKVQ
jgi:hypothetical protein